MIKNNLYVNITLRKSFRPECLYVSQKFVTLRLSGSLSLTRIKRLNTWDHTKTPHDSDSAGL